MYRIADPCLEFSFLCLLGFMLFLVCGITEISIAYHHVEGFLKINLRRRIHVFQIFIRLGSNDTNSLHLT